MTDQHVGFLKRLDSSRPAVFKVAEWLHRRGFTVKVPSTMYAPDATEHTKYVDDGDILIKKPTDENWLRVEVKQINTDFDCRDNWPFPVVLVSNKKSVDRAMPVPVSYVIVNKLMTHAGIIYTKTKEKWSEKNILAKNTNNIETFYVCDPSIVKFLDLRS